MDSQSPDFNQVFAFVCVQHLMYRASISATCCWFWTAFKSRCLLICARAVARRKLGCGAESHFNMRIQKGSRARTGRREARVFSRGTNTQGKTRQRWLSLCVCLLAARAAYTEKAKIKTPKHSGRPHHSLIIHDMDSRRGSEITARASVSNQAFSTYQSVRLLGKLNKRGRLAFCTLRRVFSPRTTPVFVIFNLERHHFDVLVLLCVYQRARDLNKLHEVCAARIQFSVWDTVRALRRTELLQIYAESCFSTAICVE